MTRTSKKGEARSRNIAAEFSPVPKAAADCIVVPEREPGKNTMKVVDFISCRLSGWIAKATRGHD